MTALLPLFRLELGLRKYTKFFHIHKLPSHCKTQYRKFETNICVASVPISTFMRLWAILYITTIGLHILLQENMWTDPENHSQTHDCGSWDWGRTIPFLRIHKYDFRYIAKLFQRKILLTFYQFPVTVNRFYIYIIVTKQFSAVIDIVLLLEGIKTKMLYRNERYWKKKRKHFLSDAPFI